MFSGDAQTQSCYRKRQMHSHSELPVRSVSGDLRRLTFELSGGEAVRLNEGLGVTGGGQARYGLNATDPAAARHGAAKGAHTFAERQRPQTD